GLLRGGRRPVAPRRRRLRRGGAGDRARLPRADAGVGAARQARRRDLRQGGRAMPALRREDPGARPVGRQPQDVLVPELPALKRVGHKGADLIVPGNTPASFDAALKAGVDMIEFDVLPEFHDRPDHGRLLLAHDYSVDLATAPTLEQGLAHLASSAFAGVELDVDLKLPGYEAETVEALRRHGLVERTLISSNWMRSLVTIRALEPRL